VQSTSGAYTNVGAAYVLRIRHNLRAGIRHCAVSSEHRVNTSDRSTSDAVAVHGGIQPKPCPLERKLEYKHASSASSRREPLCAWPPLRPPSLRPRRCRRFPPPPRARRRGLSGSSPQRGTTAAAAGPRRQASPLFAASGWRPPPPRQCRPATARGRLGTCLGRVMDVSRTCRRARARGRQGSSVGCPGRPGRRNSSGGCAARGRAALPCAPPRWGRQCTRLEPR